MAKPVAGVDGVGDDTDLMDLQGLRSRLLAIWGADLGEIDLPGRVLGNQVVLDGFIESSVEQAEHLHNGGGCQPGGYQLVDPSLHSHLPNIGDRRLLPVRDDVVADQAPVTVHRVLGSFVLRFVLFHGLNPGRHQDRVFQSLAERLQQALGFEGFSELRA